MLSRMASSVKSYNFIMSAMGDHWSDWKEIGGFVCLQGEVNGAGVVFWWH
jgi:hypothetical protein